MKEIKKSKDIKNFDSVKHFREVKTKISKTHPIKYTLKEMFGGATEMVIKKPSKEVFISL